MIARALIVMVMGALLGFQVVRTAMLEAPLQRATVGPRLWESHPAVETDRIMAEIGVSARRGEALSPAVLRSVADISRKAPLAPEPFLVAGAVAQADNKQRLAERLFTEARRRDPRSEAARYFLADRYLRTGRTGEALEQMAVFARLLPTAMAQFAPAVATFARTPGAVPQLRSFFRSSPEFEPLVLDQLAADARNADLILALAGPPERRTGAAVQPWQARIVSALVEDKQFAKAFAVWRSVAGVVASEPGLFNPGFTDLAAPPPFNWSFATSGGVAEPASGGRLNVIYYGRQDTILAQQLLLLAPGRYRLSMIVSGQAGDGSVGWSLTCLPDNKTILALPLRRAAGSVSALISVSQDCPAQRLQLAGYGGEFPQSLDFAIGQLELKRVAAP